MEPAHATPTTPEITVTFDLWASFTIATFILLVIPGPTILLVVSYALGQGRRTAFAMVAGVALGDLVAMSVSLMGLGAVMLASATLFTAMKWGGALYLAYIGIRMILGAHQATARIASVSGKTGKRAFRDAAMVTVLNPKSIGFFVAFVPQFVEPGQPLFAQFLIMVITFVTLGTLNALAYAMLASHLRDRLKKLHLLAWMQRMGGVVLIGMAGFTTALKRS